MEERESLKEYLEHYDVVDQTRTEAEVLNYQEQNEVPLPQENQGNNNLYNGNGNNNEYKEIIGDDNKYNFEKIDTQYNEATKKYI